MSDPRFTPGPWLRGEEHETMAQITDSNGAVIAIAHAICPPGGPGFMVATRQMDANAAAIRALPMLYHGLTHAIDALRTVAKYMGDSERDVIEIANQCEKAIRAANGVKP